MRASLSGALNWHIRDAITQVIPRIMGRLPVRILPAMGGPESLRRCDYRVPNGTVPEWSLRYFVCDSVLALSGGLRVDVGPGAVPFGL